jgi:CelD/BcsL family acetyltransferase involved in cellulose biosynthesis
MNSTVVIREASSQEVLDWDDLVTRFDNYRIVHKLAWLRSLEACVRGKLLYLIYEKDGEIVGCLPGFLVTIGLLRLFGSPLPGWQTISMGPAFDKNRISTHEVITLLLSFLRNRYRIHHLELMSRELDLESMEALGFRGQPIPTYRVQLHAGDEDRMMRTLKDSARRNVRRGIRLGLDVKFEDGEVFVDEIYDQIKEVFIRGRNTVPFSKKRVLEYFRHMKAAGNLLATSVYLPNNGINIATGLFTAEGKELLLWQWAHRTQYRWYRPTELMTWTVIKKAMEAGCDTLDLMGDGEFKAKFGAKLDTGEYRWVWSRYKSLIYLRDLAEKCYRWYTGVR